MISCPNKRLKVWKDLVKNVGENTAYLLWAEYDGNVPDSFYNKTTSGQATSVNLLENQYKPKNVSLDEFFEEGANQIFALNDRNYQPESNIRNSVNEFILFNGEIKKEYSSLEVLDNIIKNFTGFSPLGERFAKRAKWLAERTNAKVKIVQDYEMPNDNVMEYDRVTNTILIEPNRIRKDGDTDFIVKAFLHEIVHSVTVNVYNNPSTLEEKELKKFINEAYQHYMQNTDAGNLYGFTNIYEFMAEAMTDAAFQNDMLSVDRNGKKENLFQRFINLLRRVFRLEQNKKIDANSTILAIMKLSRDADSNLDFSQNLAQKKKTDNYKTDVSTVEAKLANALAKIEENITTNLEKYKWLAKTRKDEKEKENIEYYVTKLQEIKAKIAVFKDTNQALAITTFIENMMSSLDNVNKKITEAINNVEDVEDILTTVKTYDAYYLSFSVIDEIEDALTDIMVDNEQKIFTEEEFLELEANVKQARGEFANVSSKMKTLKREGMAAYLNDIKFFPQIEYKHRDRLTKEYNKAGKPGSKEQYITDRMLGRDADKIAQDVENHTQELMKNPIFDVYSGDKMFSSSINVSSELVQIMNQMLMEIDNQRSDVERKKDIEFKELFNDLVAEKGTTNIKKLYENIIETDSNGKTHLKGDYSIEILNKYIELTEQRKAHRKRLGDLRAKRKVIVEKHNTKHPEARKILKQINEEKRDNKSKVDAIQKDAFIYDKKKKSKIISPTDKYKNDLSKLSENELKVLNYFKEIVDYGHDATYGINTLKKYLFGTKFYELPKVTKSDVERVWEGDVKGIIKDKKDYLTSDRADDVDYVNKNIDLANKSINKLKVNYRAYEKDGISFNNKDQSLDLMTIFRLEFKNINRYELRRKVESELNFLVDIAEDKNYYEKEGSRKVIRTKDGKLKASKNPNSETYQMMVNILENRFYDIGIKNQVKLGKLDLNKAVSFVNSSSAFLTLSLNIASGTANVVNANAQMFLETFLKGNTFTAKNIAKANKIYSSSMLDNVSDISNPINMSFPNQVMELFHTKGLYNLSNASFLEASMVKAGLKMSSLQVFQNSGEHWIQSVITMAVLDNIKVKNSQNKYINKEGKVIEEKKAASLLDMLKRHEDTGVVDVDENVVYTSHSRVTRWNEGGKVKIDSLIRKKLYDSLGNYTETDQPEVFRHWLGKLAMLYRKYLVPMGQSRLRGIEYSYIRKEELSEDEKTFSYALQEYEEGTYVTLIRYLKTSLIDRKAGLFKVNWDNLTEYEKHNIKRSVVELVMTSAILPLSVMLTQALAEGGEDDEFLFFIAYQLRRLETELSAYRNPSETFKMLRSPIPSARLLETSINLMGNIFTPWNWDEVYKTGHNKDKNKLLIKFYKQLPVVKEFQRTYQDLFEFQNSSFGSGL